MWSAQKSLSTQTALPCVLTKKKPNFRLLKSLKNTATPQKAEVAFETYSVILFFPLIHIIDRYDRIIVKQIYSLNSTLNEIINQGRTETLALHMIQSACLSNAFVTAVTDASIKN